MKGDLAKLYWRYSASVVASFLITLFVNQTSRRVLDDQAWRGFFYLVLLVALGWFLRIKIFKDGTFFFDVDHPPGWFGKKKIVVFGRQVSDVRVENKEKAILWEFNNPSGSRMHGLSVIVASAIAVFILTHHGLVSFLSIIAVAAMMFVILRSPFVRQLGLTLLFSIVLSVWSFIRIDFEKRPEFLLLVFVSVALSVSASQLLRALELARMQWMSPQSIFRRKDEIRIWKNSVFFATLFSFAVWVAQATIPHPRSKDEDAFPPAPPKFVSEKLKRSLAEKIVDLNSSKKNEQASQMEKLAKQNSQLGPNDLSTDANISGPSSGSELTGETGSESSLAKGPSNPSSSSDSALNADKDLDVEKLGKLLKNLPEGFERSEVTSQSYVPKPEPIDQETADRANNELNDFNSMVEKAPDGDAKARSKFLEEKIQSSNGGNSQNVQTVETVKATNSSTRNGESRNGESREVERPNDHSPNNFQNKSVEREVRHSENRAETKTIGDRKAAESKSTKAQTTAGQTPLQETISEADLARERENRVQEMQKRIEKIVQAFKGAFVIVVIVVFVIIGLMYLKRKTAEKEIDSKIKDHTLAPDERERLKLLFELIRSRAKDARQEVIETYHAILEVLSSAKYNRESWNPVDQYSHSIQEQVPSIGVEFSTMTEVFSDVLYGDRDIDRLSLEAYRKHVQDILRYFRL